MITLTNNPPIEDDNSVTPVSGCLLWTLQPDDADVVSTPGTNATMVVTFPLVPVIPANGTEFTLWGYLFTIDDATPFTSNSFEVTANPVETGANFRAMLEANIFFRRSTDVVSSGGFNEVQTVTWRECKEQPRFGGPSMDFVGLESTGATVSATNGVSPVYVDGFKIIGRLLRVESSGVEWTELTKLEGFEPARTCIGSGPISIQYMNDAKRTLFPVLPDLNATSYNAPPGGGYYTNLRLTGILAAFQLEYGWIYREDCNPKSGTLMKSDRVLVLNSAFPVEDIYNVRRYWPDHPEGLPPLQYLPKFLTTQPRSIRVCEDTICWLWFLNTFSFVATNFTIRFSVYDLAGIITVHYFTMPHPAEVVQNFNVSPGFLFSEFAIDLSDVQKYEVVALGDYGLGTIFNATTDATYLLEQNCCDTHADAYFLTPAGGIGTIVIESEEFEVFQDGTEICLDIPCNTDAYQSAKKGGRTLAALRNYDRITFVARDSFSEENQKWFGDFKRSPHKWIRVDVPNEPDATPEFIAKKLIIEPGGIKVFQNGENLELKITGYMADVPTQSITEQPFQ